MEDTDNKKGRLPRLKRPADNRDPRFPYRVILIWVVVLIMVPLFWKFRQFQQDNVEELTYGQLEQKVEEGVVKKATVVAGVGMLDNIKGVYEVPAKNGVEPKSVNFAAKVKYSDDIRKFFKEHNISLEYTEANQWWMAFMTSGLLPLILIFAVIYFVFIRQIKLAGKGAMSFGKSRARMLNRDKNKVTFKEVAGMAEAKEEVEEIIQFLKDPKKFQRLGGRIPKGVLMVGPPGTGKTLLAKAIAGEADVPFFSISGSDFVEMFVGVGASRVRDMFEQGRKSAPCIIFIDEIDAVGRQRGAGLGGGNDEREQTLNSLLVEMDGFDTTEGVIIIAATNRPDVLDSALLRPGRFDRQIYVDLPDILGREQILRVHAKKISLSENVDLSVVARGTPGLSGADLANLLNEAALLAARRNKKKVEMIDVEDAREKVLFGRERRRVMDDAEKRLVAWHEAGHAIVQAVLDDGTMPVHKVTIIPRGQSLGSTTYIPTKDILTRPMKKLLDQIAMAMGGRIAEELVTGDFSNGAYSDIKQATKIARAMVCDYGMSALGPVSMGDAQDTVFLGRDITRSQHVSEETAKKIDEEVSRIISEQFVRAKEIITSRRDALDKIAAALIEHETIEGKHVLEILQHGEIRSPIVAALPPKLDEKPTEKKPAEKAATPEPVQPGGHAPAPTPA